MKPFFSSFLLFCFFCSTTLAQSSLLQAGPMVGYAERHEAMLWVQTKAAASVHIEYWPQDKPQERHRTNEVLTTHEGAYTAHLVADELTAGTHYSYELFINNKKEPRPYPLTFQALTLWEWRTDPPSARFAIGSCSYNNEAATDRPGKPYGGSNDIYTAISTKHPDAMIWMGDNVYFRETDWNSRSGMIHRYTYDRAIPQLQPLLGSVHQYAVWDDHDYGPNDSDRSFWNKETSLDVFKLFWANPSYGVAGIQGVSHTFDWADAQFFMMDDRWFRTPDGMNTEENTQLGHEQLTWLIEAMRYSKATFKFVVLGGQFINSAPVYETYSHFYGEERTKIINLIKQENIGGVVFLTGDRHNTELDKMNIPGFYPLYDFTCSPLTAGPANSEKDQNAFRMDSTLVKERNFGILELSGTKADRQLKISVYGTNGEEKWSRTILAKDIQPKFKREDD